MPNVWAFAFPTDVSGDIRQRLMLRVPWELLWSLFYHSYMDKTPVKIHDFAVSSVPWDFSVQPDPTALNAAQFCRRVCQRRLLGKDRERSKDMRIWFTQGLGRGLHVPNVLRTPNCLIWSSLRRLGENNGTSVKFVHRVMAPCATKKTQVCYRNHIATVTRWATSDLPTVVPLTLAAHKDSHLFSFCNSFAYTNISVHTANACNLYLQPFLTAHAVDLVFACGCQDHHWSLAALPEVLLLWTSPL